MPLGNGGLGEFAGGVLDAGAGPPVTTVGMDKNEAIVFERLVQSTQLAKGLPVLHM
jgi:hypothetical protein